MSDNQDTENSLERLNQYVSGQIEDDERLQEDESDKNTHTASEIAELHITIANLKKKLKVSRSNVRVGNKKIKKLEDENSTLKKLNYELQKQLLENNPSNKSKTVSY